MERDEISEYESLEKDFNNKAQQNNNIGLIFVVLMLFPVLHYIGMIGFFFFALKWANYKKKACYYQGLVDGLQRLNKNVIESHVNRMDD